MVFNNYRKRFLNQKGQALFEMILFLPILLFLYTIYYTVGNSISGSINQQKAARGYFYTRVKGNSYVVSLGDIKELANSGMKRIGFNSIGWDEKMVGGKNAIAPCFKFSSLLKNNSSEECESDVREEEGSSRFIRLFTYYGVCGPSYVVSSELGGSGSYFEIPPNGQSHSASCTLTK